MAAGWGCSLGSEPPAGQEWWILGALSSDRFPRLVLERRKALPGCPAPSRYMVLTDERQTAPLELSVRDYAGLVEALQLRERAVHLTLQYNGPRNTLVDTLTAEDLLERVRNYTKASLGGLAVRAASVADDAIRPRYAPHDDLPRSGLHRALDASLPPAPIRTHRRLPMTRLSVAAERGHPGCTLRGGTGGRGHLPGSIDRPRQHLDLRDAKGRGEQATARPLRPSSPPKTCANERVALLQDLTHHAGKGRVGRYLLQQAGSYAQLCPFDALMVVPVPGLFQIKEQRMRQQEEGGFRRLGQGGDFRPREFGGGGGRGYGGGRGQHY